ncbi:MAG: hypothetical protein A2W11_01990 [Ignavibacteria bacterium RBG_16_35_7]|nr:MAG: hypothetical protein A2W11_01990 [Ignavibacteria bacterium RBG_16_35_7]
MHGAYRTFQVLGKKNGVPKKFDDIAKSNLEYAYKNDFRKTIMEEYLQNICKNVSISINLIVLNSLNILTHNTNYFIFQLLKFNTRKEL